MWIVSLSGWSSSPGSSFVWFGIETSIFRLCCYLTLYYTSSLVLQISTHSSITPPHRTYHTHCAHQKDHQTSPIHSNAMSYASRQTAGNSCLETTQITCPECNQLMCHSTQISVQCHGGQGYHRSCCINCLLMEVDHCCFEVSPALTPEYGRS